MENKDLILLILMPVLLVGLVTYITETPVITGAVTAVPKNSELIGTYYLKPNFEISVNYDLNEYQTLKQKLFEAISQCKGDDMENCLEAWSRSTGWGCEHGDETILYDFIDKFNECISLEEETACRFFFEEKNIEDRSFELILENEASRVRIDLIEGNKILASDYLDSRDLRYTGYEDRSLSGTFAEKITIKLKYENGIPTVSEAYANTGNTKIDINKRFLVYRTRDEVKFIDSAEERNFEAPNPELSLINLPKIKGLKLCAKSEKQIQDFDINNNKLIMTMPIYEFSVTIKE